MQPMKPGESRIEIFRPFGKAFELTKQILFQPFDLKRWLVIGFAAWLAHLGAGGGLNFRYNWSQSGEKLQEDLTQIPRPLLVIGISALICFLLALGILFTWLRARGRFVFIDCLVKNRAAIAEPWREFRREANSYFLFSLLAGLCFGIIAALLSLPFILPMMRGNAFLREHFLYAVSSMVAWGFTLIVIILAWSLLANFMAPVMYRQRCGSWEAFRTVARLLGNYPGEVLLYCLFLIVLGLATALISCLVTCATCCLAAIPYVGTVILLPVFVLLCLFPLLFLRQFGPDYDVWAAAMPPEFAAVLLPTPPTVEPSSAPPADATEG